MACRVPFVPAEGRPVYCEKCYREKRRELVKPANVWAHRKDRPFITYVYERR
jgi:hypothetical protein